MQAWKSILPRLSISGHPLSVQGLEWVQSFLQKCQRDHASCGTSLPPRLPKRVLCIENEHDNIGIKVQLVQDGNRRSNYVALSHCWGTHQTCTTTRDNLKDRISGVPWKLIPKTFQDAIKLALKLGFSYIWIDSLCIIQDDAMDWETESSKMAEIYQDAALTLAATSSTGDYMGCYSEDMKAPNELELQLPEDVGACRIAVRQPLQHWGDQTTTGLNLHFPLLTRGWAFQERLLSARVLHLCRSELVWECREMTACECGNLGENVSPGATYYHAVEENREEKRHYEEIARIRAEKIAQEPGSEPAPPSYDDIVVDQGDASAPINNISLEDSEMIVEIPVYQANNSDEEVKDCPDLVFHFHRIVEQYSALQLTKASDRLPALSGLCRRVQNLRGDYLAGLWSDSICFDLMWRVNTIKLDIDNEDRSLGYRGPSWSWISVDSPVTYWPDIMNFKSSKQRQLMYRRHMTGEMEHYLEEDFLVEDAYTPLGRNADKIIPIVWTPGQNPFGSVTFGLLTVEASTIQAELQYTINSYYWTGESSTSDISRYKLLIKGGSELPFFADYALAAEGPRKIPDGTQLTLLLVHPKVCLVLYPKMFNGVPLMFDGEAVMQRIGIVRISETLVRYYNIDWMKGSETKKLRIL